MKRRTATKVEGDVVARRESNRGQSLKGVLEGSERGDSDGKDLMDQGREPEELGCLVE